MSPEWQRDAWLREAEPALAELLELERNEGPAAARERMEQLRQAYLGLRDSGFDRPLAEVSEERLDAQIARTKGVWVLRMLQDTVGEQRASLWQFWVEGTGLPDYMITGARARPAGGGFIVTMRVVNRGTGKGSSRLPAPGSRRGTTADRLASELPPSQPGAGSREPGAGAGRWAGPPVPAAIQTEEGARHYFPISVPAGESREISYATITRPVAAAIDPEGEILAAQARNDWHPIRVRRWWIF